MVQPSVARIFMADPLAVDTGFLPRFLICEPQSTIGSRLQANTTYDELALNTFSRRMRLILEAEMPMDAETRELRPRVLELAPDARALVAAFADAVEQAQGAGGSLAHITGTASKVAEQACRIAGVLTLWRDLNATDVPMSAMENGVALAKFYLSEASRLASAAVVSAEIDNAESYGGGYWKAGLSQRFWCGMSFSLALTLCVKRRRLGQQAPSFITRVCGFGFHILRRQFEQARRVRSPQIAQALGALQRVFGCPEMSAV